MTFAVMQNGVTSLPLKRTAGGRVIPDASLAEVHEAAKERVETQIRTGIRADDLGLDYLFFTEHHFQPTGSEFSPNPLMSQVKVATETETIRLGQMANILTWHDPVRFAEQAAMLDILSDGRAEIGIGRGYQPRENEVLGQYWGGTIQDQERNRRTFEEKFELLTRCWTRETVSYHGEEHQVPPRHTKWHHELDRAYYEDDVTEQTVDDMLDWVEEGDFYSDLWNRVMSGGTTLKRISVFPQPLQEPHPQLWMPATSHRSLRFAARNGVNGGLLAAPTERLGNLVDVYFEAAERAGWPDHRPEYDGESLGYGWDGERRRGLIPFRYVWNTEVADEATTERWKLGQENVWNYYRSLIPVYRYFDRGEDEWIPGDAIVDHEMMHVGTTEEIIDGIAALYETLDYEEIAFGAFFESPGVGAEAEEKQMVAFAEEVVPYLEDEFATGD